MLTRSKDRKRDIHQENGSDEDDSLSSIHMSTKNSSNSPALPSPALPPVLPSQKKRIQSSQKYRSPFLRFFDDSNGLEFVSCLTCKEEVRYLYRDKKVTSSLQEHLKKRHPEQFEEVAMDDKERHKRAQKHFLMAVARGGFNISSLHSGEVRAFVKALDPTFAFPSPESFGTLLDEEYEDVHNKLLDSLRHEEVTITFDNWAYVCGFTVSFIDADWQRQFYILPFEHSKFEVDDIMRGASPYKFKRTVACITQRDEFEDYEFEKRLDCALHACDNFVSEFIDEIEEGHGFFRAFRRLVFYFDENEDCREEFKKRLVDAQCKETSLPYGARDLWTTTLRMLRIASIQINHLKDSSNDFFNDCLINAGREPLKDIEVLQIEQLVKFLDEVEQFAIKMSTHQSTLSSLIPYVKALEKAIDELNVDESQLQIYHNYISELYNKYLAPLIEGAIVQRAFLLDPRFVHPEIAKLLDEQVRSNQLKEIFEQADGEFEVDGRIEARPPKMKRSSLLSKIVPQIQPMEDSPAKNEYDLFVKLAIEDDLSEEAEVCDFWRHHQKKLPRLAPIARQLLAIPPSSIPDERFLAEMGPLARSLTVETGPKDPKQKRKLLFLCAHSKKSSLRFNDEQEYHEFFLRAQLEHEKEVLKV